jgi:hypothetical protein
MSWPSSFTVVLLAVLAAGCSTSRPLPRAEWSFHLDGSHPPDSSVDPQPQSSKKVRVVYLTPSDRTASQTYSGLLEKGARHLQRWFRDAMPGKTFTLASPVVAERKTQNPASWYSTHLASGSTEVSFWDNVYADANDAASVQRSDPDNVWLVYIDADPACGQAGGCMDGVCVFSANDLRGLAQEKLAKVCSTDSDTPLPVCRWVGGMGQMLGLGLGLPFPPGCPEHLTSCDSSALMWSGMYDYPNTHLTASDRATLAKNPFFSNWASLTPLGSCNPL